MPTYDYLCQQCQHEFEQFQNITARPLRKCPKCGKLKLKRLIGTGAGVIFKGSGFYETDYRSENYKKQAKQEKDAAAKTGKSDESSSDKSKSSDAKSTSKTEKNASGSASDSNSKSE